MPESDLPSTVALRLRFGLHRPDYVRPRMIKQRLPVHGCSTIATGRNPDASKGASCDGRTHTRMKLVEVHGGVYTDVTYCSILFSTPDSQSSRQTLRHAAEFINPNPKAARRHAVCAQIHDPCVLLQRNAHFAAPSIRIMKQLRQSLPPKTDFTSRVSCNTQLLLFVSHPLPCSLDRCIDVLEVGELHLHAAARSLLPSTA